MTHPLARAIEPLVRAIGASVRPAEEASDTDVVLSWLGEPTLAVRLDLSETLQGMIASVEDELGDRLDRLPREAKQVAVRILDERGAFTIRKAIEEVAEVMGVSRITIYNYLNAIRKAE